MSVAPWWTEVDQAEVEHLVRRLRNASACATWVSEGLRLLCDVDVIDEELGALGGLERDLHTLADELEREAA